MMNGKLKEEIKKLANELRHEKDYSKELERITEDLTIQLNKAIDAEVIIVDMEEVNLAKNRGFSLQQVIYNDVFETKSIPTGVSSSTNKVFQIRKPFFVMTKTRDQALEEYRKKVEVGVSNFTEYDRVVSEIDLLTEKIVRLEESSKDQNVGHEKELAFIQYMNESLGQNVFMNHKSEFERSFKARNRPIEAVQ